MHINMPHYIPRPNGCQVTCQTGCRILTKWWQRSETTF